MKELIADHEIAYTWTRNVELKAFLRGKIKADEKGVRAKMNVEPRLLPPKLKPNSENFFRYTYGVEEK
jgi:hypothetical protein